MLEIEGGKSKEATQFQWRYEDQLLRSPGLPSIWSSASTTAMASDTSMPAGRTTIRNTSVPTASLGCTSTTARRCSSYTAQHRRA